MTANDSITAAPRSVERRRPTIATLAIAGVLAVGVTCCAVLVWASRRGFDVTDEGLYLLNYLVPGPDRYFPSQYDVLVDLALGPLTPGPVALRLARLLVELLGGGLLGWAVVVAARRRLWPVSTSGALLIVASTSVFGLLSHTWLPASPGYNTLSALFVTTAVALTMLVASGKGPLTRADGMAAAAIGGLVTIELAVKWPAALCTGAACGAAMAWLRPAAALRSALWALAGAALVVGLVTDVGFGGVQVEAVREANRLASGTAAFTPSAVLDRYATSLRDDLRVAGTGGGLVATVAFASLFLPAAGRARTGWASWVARVLAVAGGLVLTGGVVLQATGSDRLIGSPRSPTVVIAPIAGLVAAGLACAVVDVVRAGRPPPVDAIPIAALLLVTPLLAAFGSSNPIMRQSLTAGAGYGAALGLGAVALARRTCVGRAGPLVGLLLAAALVGVQVVHGTVLEPYRLGHPLSRQNESIDHAGLQWMLLDSESVAFIDELRDVVEERTEFEPGDPVLGVSRLPGLVYVLSGTTPGPSYIPPAARDQQVVCRSLEDDRDTLQRTEVVILVDEPVAPELDRCLTRLWPAWPDRLALVASLSNPWAKAAGMPEEVRVYAVS